jgi:hypothetical protein
VQGPVDFTSWTPETRRSLSVKESRSLSSLPLAQLRSEIEATNLHLDRIVVHPGATRDQDNAELVLAKDVF